MSKETIAEADSAQSNDNVDEILKAGTDALSSSAAMFGNPLSDNSVSTESRSKNEVENVLASTAEALSTSAGMFADPLETKESSDEDTDLNATLICEEDEKDLTKQNTDFNFPVRIHLMQKSDEKVAYNLIYNGIYETMFNRHFMTIMERSNAVIFIGIFAVLLTLFTGSVIWGISLSVLGLPFGGYFIGRYMVLPLYCRRYVRDISVGLFNYWSETLAERLFLVAEVDDKIVGCVAMETHSARAVEMKYISVALEMQCVGIGNLLANHVIDYVTKHGFRKLIAQAPSASHECVAMYTKLGFKKRATRKVWKGLSQVEEFEKKLAQTSIEINIEEVE